MRTKNSSLNIICGIISLILTSILGFILSKIFLNNLGLEYNGLNGVFNNIINILAITELGIAGAINYALYKPIYEKDYSKISLILAIYKKFYKIIGSIIFILALFVTIFIPVFFKERTILDNYIRFSFVLCTINTVVSYFFAYSRNIFYAMQKNYIISIIDCIFKIFKYLTQIITLIIFKNFIIYLIINIIFTLANNLTIYIISCKYFKNINLKCKTIDKEIEKDILKSVKKLAIVQLLSTLINFTDNLIISSFISITSSGLYVNYNFIFSQLNQIITTIFHGIGASIGNLISENNKDKIKNIFVNLQYVAFFIGLFCVICLYFLTEPFITLWIGKEYLLSNSVLIVLIINLYLFVNRQPINYYMNTGGYFKKLIFPLSLEAILNLIISIILAIKIGLIGVFLGTLISSIISYFICAFRISKIIDLDFKKYILKQIIFIFICVINIIIFKSIFMLYLPHNLIMQLAYILVIILIIYGIEALILLFKDKNISYLKELLCKILFKIFHRKITN